MNPLTGRFMSRDPKTGNARNPSSLHKYSYANADPINRLDPTGRGAIIEFVLLRFTPAALTFVTTKCVVDFALSELGYNYSGMWCPYHPMGSGGQNGNGNGGGQAGSGSAPIAGPGNPPPPPLQPGCNSPNQQCIPGGGNLANAQKLAQPVIDNSNNLECVSCAQNLANEFSAAGYDGQYVYARTSAQWITSDFAPGDEAISQNGFHQAVVLDINGEQYVFDNFANGVPLSEWESALHAASQIQFTFGPW